MSKSDNYDRHEIVPVRDPQPDEASLRHYVEFVFDEDCIRLGRYNRDWFLSPHGDMYSTTDYIVPGQRLQEEDWLLHLMGKEWFDANTFLPAYFEACRRANIKRVTILTHY